MLKPIAPLIEYALNYQYIAKVLCINKELPQKQCNGKCYVIKKIQEQEQEQKKTLRISMKEYPIGFVILQSFKEKKASFLVKKRKISYLNNYVFLYENLIFHPPCVSFSIV